MSRYKPNREVHADWWDPDEVAVFKGSLAFLSAQRVQLFMGKVQSMTPSTEDETAIMVEFMAKVLLELLESWTLRQKQTPYQPGIDRPRLGLTLEEIAQLPVEDITYLYKLGGESLITSSQGATITPAAQEAGLTPANFRSGDPGPVHLPIRPDTAAGSS